MSLSAKINYFLRKKYWWTNTLFGLFIFASILFLIIRDMSLYWIIIPLVPLFYLNVTNLQMTMGKKEVVGFIFSIAIILYSLLAWSKYKKSGNIYDVFALETIKTFLLVLLFIGIPALIFGYLPIMLLTIKDRRYPRKWKSDDNFSAAFYIFRKLPSSIASKTSLKELEEMSASTILPINTKLEKADLKTIAKLKDSWMKKSGIKDIKIDEI